MLYHYHFVTSWSWRCFLYAAGYYFTQPWTQLVYIALGFVIALSVDSTASVSKAVPSFSQLFYVSNNLDGACVIQKVAPPFLSTLPFLSFFLAGPDFSNQNIPLVWALLIRTAVKVSWRFWEGASGNSTPGSRPWSWASACRGSPCVSSSLVLRTQFWPEENSQRDTLNYLIYECV